MKSKIEKCISLQIKSKKRMRDKLYTVLLDLNVVATRLGTKRGVYKPNINTSVWLQEEGIIREIDKVTKFIKNPEYSYLKK